MLTFTLDDQEQQARIERDLAEAEAFRQQAKRDRWQAEYNKHSADQQQAQTRDYLDRSEFASAADVENRIYHLIGTVTEDSAHQCAEFLTRWARQSPLDSVGIILSTFGGEVFPGMALVDTILALRANGLPVTITVDAYPNRPFQGTVLKIEPQATVNQNVTMFPVLVNIYNPEHLLKPGMNAEVEVHVGQRQGVLAIPNAALRTQRDVASAAQVLGLDPNDVQAQLAASPAAPSVRAGGDTAQRGGATLGGDPARPNAPRDTAKAASNVMTTPDGRQITLPAGYTPEKIRELFRKAMSGGTLTPAEQAAMNVVRSQFGGGRGGQGGGTFGPGQMRRGGAFASSYIVFALRNGKPTPVNIRTGLTDLDYIEVSSGLTETDTVLLLPSASLVQAQQDMRNRFQSMTGGGLPGLRQQTPASGSTGSATTRNR